MSPKWETEAPRLEKYTRIHCFTCAKDVPGKRFLKSHIGHDVHYVKDDGTIDE